jgi:tRNA (mo5U34)-methyltransferase
VVDERQAALARLDGLDGQWWHSIDLGDGIWTEGRKTPDMLRDELSALDLPDLAGKTVLDIGAWDGFFSFEAERQGAKRVVALDHYVWSLDLDAQHGYLERCQLEGRTPAPWHEVPEVWKPDELPGKVCFDTAVTALGSSVESVVGDFMAIDLDEVGTFDVVLFLGVLYHLLDPFLAIRRLAEVTNEVAVIETAGVRIYGYETQELLAFYPEDQLLGDPTNWWAPNEAALTGMCRAAGFSRIETKVTASAVPKSRLPSRQRARRAIGSARRAWSGRQPLRPCEDIRLVARAWK